MPLPYTGTDLRLLASLVQFGKLTQEQSDAVKLESVQQNKPETQIIIEKGFLSENDLFRIKAQVYNIPYVDEIQSINVSQELLLGINVDTLREQNAFPFEVTDDKVKILMADPFDIGAIQFWKVRYAPKQIEVYAGAPSQVISFINTRFGSIIGGEVQAAVQSYKLESGTETIISDDVGDIGSNLQSAPVAKIVNMLLALGARSNASDIHIEPQEKTIRVRYRIDGVMVEKTNPLPKELLAPIVARIKIMSNLKIDESRLPQDERLFIKVDDRSFDIRVSTLPNIQGEKIVLRLLERTAGIAPLEESGLRGSGYKKYLESIRLTNGIILITGPTGSGKTRTLASTMAKLNDPKINIITIEDPVEIRIPGITQVQVNHDIGLDFAMVLRSVLRQDPNIVMVGEIRDGETASLAIRAALTGHLVLSTLHTNNAVAALTRLIDMDIEPFLVASTVKCVVAQRLVRTICPYCREAHIATEAEMKEVSPVIDAIKGFDMMAYLSAVSERNGNPDPASKDFRFAPPVKAPETDETGQKKIYLYEGKGCTQCGGTGYKGRMAIFEVITINESMSDAIVKRLPYEELQRITAQQGMLNMYQDGFLKAIEGITTIGEVIRVAKSE